MSCNIFKAVSLLKIFLLLEFLTFRIQDIIKFYGLGELLSFTLLTGSETFSKLCKLSVPLFLYLWYIALHILESVDRLNEFLHVWGLEQCLTHSRWSTNVSFYCFEDALWHRYKWWSASLGDQRVLWCGQATRSSGKWGTPRTQWSNWLRVLSFLAFYTTSSLVVWSGKIRYNQVWSG